MSNLLTAFLLDRKASGCTAKTLQWHEACLGLFYEYLQEENYSINPTEWTPTLLRAYIVHLQSRSSRRGDALSASSINSYARSLLCFVRWLHEEGYTDTNIGERVKKPRLPQTIKEPFTNAELHALLKAAKETNNPERDYAMLSVLVDCGLRASELTNLRTKDVLTDQNVLVIKSGKGNKDRIVPYSAGTARALRRYERTRDSDSPYLFVSAKGGKLMPNSLKQLVERIAKRTNVENAYPHRFRHTFAVSFLRNGGNPLTLQRLLGHTTLTMTNGYVAMNTDDLRSAHAVASPLTSLLRKAH